MGRKHFATKPVAHGNEPEHPEMLNSLTATHQKLFASVLRRPGI